MRYSYSGPVMEFDKCIGNVSGYSTTANSKARAKGNIEYQIKMKLGLLPNSRITIDASRLKGEDLV